MRNSIAHIQFQTPRLKVQHCASTMADPLRLHAELAIAISAETTKYLPPDLQYPGQHKSIAHWLDVLTAQAEVLLVRHAESAALSGLVILNVDNNNEIPDVFLGYLLAEKDWGKGFASELVMGLVEHLRLDPPVSLYAGVEADNPASARILEKAGFSRLPTEPKIGNDFFSLQIK